MTDCDVLIIGAGPVGLTLANELARRGVRLRIIDKLASIREVSKALILHVRTQEALSKVGIMSEALAEAEPMREVVVHAYGKHIGSWNLDGIDSSFSHPLIIGQNRTQHLLLDRLIQQGREVEWKTEALDLKVETSGVIATLQSPDSTASWAKTETIRARYVVGCEGSKSLVRATLGLTFEGERYSGEQFIQADCKLKWDLPKGRSYLFLTTDGYMMAIELPNGYLRIFISIPDAVGTTHPTQGQKEAEKSLGAAEDISAEPTLDEIKSHFERLSGLKVLLSDPVWLARYRTSHRYANQFHVGRAFVAGDSGHVHVPIGGQGMNTGIQDVFNLGWKLAGVINGQYPDSLLETYNAERHPIAEGLIKGTDFAYKGILHPSEVKQRMVRVFGPYVMRTDQAQNFMRSTLEELSIAYPKSTLSQDLGGGSGPVSGDSMKDAVVVRSSDKRTVRLSEIAQYSEWTLLLFAGTYEKQPPFSFAPLIEQVRRRSAGIILSYLIVTQPNPVINSVSEESILVDGLQEAHTKYGVSRPMLYLIRPDAYIGFRGPLEASEELMSYLDRILTPFSEK